VDNTYIEVLKKVRENRIKKAKKNPVKENTQSVRQWIASLRNREEDLSQYTKTEMKNSINL
jgi:hypothetical protein